MSGCFYTLTHIHHVKSRESVERYTSLISVSEMDPGTAYELGFGNGLGKMSYGYISEMIDLVKRVIRDYLTTKGENLDGGWGFYLFKN